MLDKELKISNSDLKAIKDFVKNGKEQQGIRSPRRLLERLKKCLYEIDNVVMFLPEDPFHDIYEKRKREYMTLRDQIIYALHWQREGRAKREFVAGGTRDDSIEFDEGETKMKLKVIKADVKKVDNALDDLLDGMETLLDPASTKRLLDYCSEYELNNLKANIKSALLNGKKIAQMIDKKLNEIK